MPGAKDKEKRCCAAEIFQKSPKQQKRIQTSALRKSIFPNGKNPEDGLNIGEILFKLYCYHIPVTESFTDL